MISIQEYQPSLDLTTTLYFEVYHGGSAERYHSKWLVLIWTDNLTIV